MEKELAGKGLVCVLHASKIRQCAYIYRPQGKGNVFTGVCLSTIGLLVNRYCSAWLWRGQFAFYWNAFLFFFMWTNI